MKKQTEKTTCLYTKEKEPIFRIDRILLAIVILGAVYLFLALPVMDSFFKTIPFYSRIIQQSLGILYETQLTLFATALSTLAIVTSFLEKRYLGASYKHWFFEETVFFFTPQEIILLMAVNQIGGLAFEITGMFRAIALLSFALCWGLFLYLIYQVYVYTIKMSRVFNKLRQHLIEFNPEKKKTLCDSIYKKVKYYELQANHNSYLFEEIEILLQMLFIYKSGLADSKCKQEDIEKIQTIAKIVPRIIEHEVEVRSDSNTENTNILRTELVSKTIDKGNELEKESISCKEHTYNYKKELDARENLSEATKEWSSLPQEINNG